jgi:peptidoglycan/LPS O-acetylase OafA/YrhL
VSTTNSRLPALDGLRGLAILLVVVSHLDPTVVRYGGAVGVTLFFVLSGYLITTLLLAERSQHGRVDLRAFYARRALRLLPALLLIVSVIPAVMLLVDDPRFGPRYIPIAGIVLLYLSDFVRAIGLDLDVFGHTWSLAVEEQFYLLWPLALGLLIARSRGNSRRLSRLVVGLAAIAAAWRLLAATVLPFDWAYFAPDTNAFALLFGCALACRERSHGLRTPSWTLPAAVAGLVALALVPSVDLYGTDLTVLAYGVVPAAAVAVLAVAGARQHPWGLLTSVPLRWLGTVSYGLYLWHEALLLLRPDGQPWSYPARFAVVATSVAAAWLSWKLVEQPIQRRRRHRYLRARPPLQETTA